MKTLILPFRLKKQAGKLTRLVYNENEYQTNFEDFKKEVYAIHSSFENMEISKNELIGQILNCHVTENHSVFNVGKWFTLKLINIHRIPAFHSVESVANSIN
jgi:hypothetical protein